MPDWVLRTHQYILDWANGASLAEKSLSLVVTVGIRGRDRLG